MIIRITSLCSINSLSGLKYGMRYFLFIEIIKPIDYFNVKFKSRSPLLISLLLSCFYAFKICYMPLKPKKKTLLHFINFHIIITILMNIDTVATVENVQ